MGLKCTNIEGLRAILNNGSQEIKPNGQIKHTIGDCTINTYDTGSVVIQDNTKNASNKEKVETLIESINNINQPSCKNKKG